jgi:hypothetical protein
MQQRKNELYLLCAALQPRDHTHELLHKALSGLGIKDSHHDKQSVNEVGAHSGRPRSDSSVSARERMASAVHKLNEHAAVDIFKQRKTHTTGDGTSFELAAKYNITMKAVRDVWNTRTWAWTTMPYWTDNDREKFLLKQLCTKCRSNGVTSLSAACKSCEKPRRRGRPNLKADGSGSSKPQSRLVRMNLKLPADAPRFFCQTPQPDSEHSERACALLYRPASASVSRLYDCIEDYYAEPYTPTSINICDNVADGQPDSEHSEHACALLYRPASARRFYDCIEDYYAEPYTPCTATMKQYDVGLHPTTPRNES